MCVCMCVYVCVCVCVCVCVYVYVRMCVYTHRNTEGESPCVANVKNCVRKTLECPYIGPPS